MIGSLIPIIAGSAIALVELAKTPDFYVLNARAGALRLMLRGAELRTFPVLEVQVGSPRIGFLRCAAVGAWQGVVWSGGVLDPPREMERVELAVPSPDGRCIAFTSTDSLRPEVYVQAVADAQHRWQVSVQGGGSPVWRRDGKELYFLGPDYATIHAVTVRQVGRSLEIGPPSRLFTSPMPLLVGIGSAYDATSDGQRFLLLTGTGSGPTELNIVLNWQAKLPR